MPNRVAVAIEAADKKAFATAVDWPGWSRAGKTREAAIENLFEYADRYAPVAALAGVAFPSKDLEADIVEDEAGDASTEYGVPGTLAEPDRRPTDVDAAARLVSLVEAAWTTFDTVTAKAPPELRKGPRRGGRDTAKIVDHVVTSDHAYAGQLGLKLPAPKPTDRRAVRALRDEILEVLRQPSDGSPIGKRWTARYAARRIAWHALDHAWEIEDRTET